MYNHVNWSDDADHGPAGSVPNDEFDIEDFPVVGTVPVELDRKEAEQDHDRYVCEHCGHIFHGRRGLRLHLSQADDPFHPEDEDTIARHRRFPAFERKIHVPHESYKHVIHLTDSEINEGFEIVVDDTLALAEEHLDTDGDRVLSALREHYRNLLEHDEDVDPLAAYSAAERAIVNQ